MRIRRVRHAAVELLETDAPGWRRLEAQRVALAPAPLALAVTVSPQLVLRQDHGKVPELEARWAHDGRTLSLRLAWADAQADDRIDDLDRFVDAAAVMFPLSGEPNPLTMGDEANPVNAWLWRADREEPFDVIGRGFSTTRRRPAATSGLVARSRYREGAWAVVFQRPLQPSGPECVAFEPGGTTRIAFAVWEGSHAERAGQKAMSGAFLELALDA